ncbi:hypothetical protein QN397_24025 [Variovorax sp. RTB1]|uniref:hypothetical protein n=1 Tax=Variovorax sp. RTB1 TaxID=3048631 RepID=UPI002B22BD6A|nr:hypothetical protein [Variovorax sp. RTB1]MEB0114352.1 hypothetical protein [Variovorax sp. RTB1]
MRTDHYIDVRIRIHRAESPALYARIDEVIERSPRAAAATIRRLADLGVMVEQGRLSSGVPRAVVTRVLAVPQAIAARVPADTARERTHELVAHQAAESAELAMPASPPASNVALVPQANAAATDIATGAEQAPRPPPRRNDGPSRAVNVNLLTGD